MGQTHTLFPSEKDIIPLSLFVRRNMACLHPVYFAMIMATGIISINFHLFGFTKTAFYLFALNILFYASLSVLYLGRIAFFTSDFFNDCSDHQRAPGFFTVIAASSILGTQFYLIANSPFIAKFFFGIAVILWIVAIYSIFLLLTIKKDKPVFNEGINGGWLVSIVATQSISVVGSIFINPADNNETLFFILTTFWLFGGMLYIWIISIIFYRYMFFKFDPNDLMPPYWINMGAMAISSLAGSLILLKATESKLLTPMIPFIKGLTLMYWATASWWIPMLLLLGVWRHFMRGVKITYSPLYWGLVFPLGMYSASTLRLTQILDVPPFLIIVAKLFAIIGASAWTITFLGMLTRIIHGISLGFHSKRINRKYHLRSFYMDIKKNIKRIKTGQKLVFVGVIIIVLGIILYCVNGFMFGVQHEINEFFLVNNSSILYISLTFIFGGTVLWIIGLVKYLNGVMEQYGKE